MSLGSGIRKKPIQDPGSRGQKGTGPGSGSATLEKTWVLGREQYAFRIRRVAVDRDIGKRIICTPNTRVGIKKPTQKNPKKPT